MLFFNPKQRIEERQFLPAQEPGFLAFNQMKKLTPTESEELKISLNYLLMEELKEICAQCDISSSGKKGEIIERILHYIHSGKQLPSHVIPPESKAKKGEKYSVAPNTLILSGAYKNDNKTRLFLKRLIGEHFHFTAFGQDWIKERWLKGDPPTYREFALFWQKEYESRKKKRAEPKNEWAYLNFIQRHPNISKEEIPKAWKGERLAQAKKAKTLIKKALKNLDKSD